MACLEKSVLKFHKIARVVAEKTVMKNCTKVQDLKYSNS